MTFTLVTCLMVLILIETLVTITVWATRSPWWKYSAGQSVMALLIAQIGIVGLAVMSRVFGYEFPNRDLLYSAFYLVLVVAMGWVCITIIRAQNADREKVS